MKNGRTLYDSMPENSPKAGINLDTFWDYYKNGKTEFDKVCLLAYLAIRSVLQNQAYTKLTTPYLLSRMAGKTHSIAPEALPHDILKYNIDYRMRKIKTALRDGWGLITYSRHLRGFYVSYKMTLDELVFEAEKRRKSTKEKQYKLKEKEALAKALQKLNA